MEFENIVCLNLLVYAPTNPGGGGGVKMTLLLGIADDVIRRVVQISSGAVETPSDMTFLLAYRYVSPLRCCV